MFKYVLQLHKNQFNSDMFLLNIKRDVAIETLDLEIKSVIVYCRITDDKLMKREQILPIPYLI